MLRSPQFPHAFQQTQRPHVYAILFYPSQFFIKKKESGGTGEYTTGWTGSGASTSDKKANFCSFSCIFLS